MGKVIWARNVSELRPFHVRASGNWMGAWPTRRRAIRHARGLLREGWASVVVEDVRTSPDSGREADQ